MTGTSFTPVHRVDPPRPLDGGGSVNGGLLLNPPPQNRDRLQLGGVLNSPHTRNYGEACTY